MRLRSAIGECGSGDNGGDKLYEHVRISKHLANHVFALRCHREPMIPSTHNGGVARSSPVLAGCEVVQPQLVGRVVLSGALA